MIIGLSGLTRDEKGNCGSAGAGKDAVADILVEDYGFVRVSLADEIKRICMRLWDFSEEQMWGDKKEEPDKRYPRKLSEFYEGVIKGLKVPREYVLPPEEAYLTPRHAMQQIGTEAARAIDPYVWTRYVFKVAKKLLTPFKPDHKLIKEGWHCYERTEGITNLFDLKEVKGIVIPDCRVIPEFESIKDPSKLWPEAPRSKLVRVSRFCEVLKGATSQHNTETEQLEFEDDYFNYVLRNDVDLESLPVLVADMMDELTKK